MKEATYHVERARAESHWWFRGRREILAAILAELPLPDRARLLDVGCGTGANARVLAGRGEVFGVDLSLTALGASAGRAERAVAQASLEAGLPFAGASFDLVTALDVLEHLDDDVGGAREIRRVLRPGGWAVFFVPALPILWGLQDDVAEHRRRYTRSSLLGALDAAGLGVQRHTYFNTLLFAPILLGRLAMRLYRPPVDSENQLTPPLLDGLLGRIFAAEAPWVAQGWLPIGVPLIALARRL